MLRQNQWMLQSSRSFKCRRRCSMLLMLLDASCLNIGQSVTMLEFCQTITMFFTNLPTVATFIRPVTMCDTTFPTFSTVPIFIQPVTCLTTNLDFSNSSNFFSTCHSVNHIFVFGTWLMKFQRMGRFIRNLRIFHSSRTFQLCGKLIMICTDFNFAISS